MNSLQLFFGRSVARVLRNFPWPIRSAVLDFPPITVKDGQKCLLVLGTPSRFLETLWSAYSWMRYLQDEVFLIVMVDGAITPEMRESYQRCFVGGRLEEAAAFLGDFSSGSSPFAAYLRNSPFGRKLGIKLKLNQEYSVFYSDNDVVVWNRPDELIETMRRDDAVMYNSSPGSPSAPTVVEAFKRRGLPRLTDLNAGLLYMPKGRLDLALATEILNEIPPDHGYTFIDQTLIDGIFAQGAVRLFPEDRYVLSSQGMWFWQADLPTYKNLVCRHFIGPVRHLMYLKGYPLLRRGVEDSVLQTSSQRG